jgi:hypothetical protein
LIFFLGACSPKKTLTYEAVPWVHSAAPGLAAALPEQRRLLVADHRQDGHVGRFAIHAVMVRAP